MKNSKRAAHLLAGSLMTAATIIGGAGVADAKTTVAEEPDKLESVTLAYVKHHWESTDTTHYDVGDVFVKIRDVDGESAARAADVYYKVSLRTVHG